jgi:hypothetical protein
MVHQSIILGIYKMQDLAEDRICSAFIRSITDPVSHTFSVGRGEGLQKQPNCPFRFALLTKREWDVSAYLTSCSVCVQSAADRMSWPIVFQYREIIRWLKTSKDHLNLLNKFGKWTVRQKILTGFKSRYIENREVFLPHPVLQTERFN